MTQEPTSILVEVKLLHDDPDRERKRQDPEADKLFLESIRATGGPVVQPVVRPHPDKALREADPPHYMIILGHRRVAACQQAGFKVIFCTLVTDAEDPAIRQSMRMADNHARAPLAPLDLWASVKEMRERQVSIETVAAVLAVPVSYARRLEKLAHVAPPVLALIDKHGMPDTRQLSVIAMAPAEVQERAAKAKDIWMGTGKTKSITWYQFAQHCVVDRISAARALFQVDGNPTGVVFDEDLFAQPGAEDAITTSDIAGFLAAQRAAVERKAADLADKGYEIRILDKSPEWGKDIDGWQVSHSMGELLSLNHAKWPKPTKKDPLVRIAIWIAPTGWQAGQVHAFAMAEYVSPRVQRKKDMAEKRLAGSAAQDVDKDEPAPGISIEGQRRVSKLKTDELRTSLMDDKFSARSLLHVLLLALTAQNVHVMGNPDQPNMITDFRDLLPLLLGGDDGMVQPSHDRLAEIAGQAIARILICDQPRSLHSSGPIADTIARILGARVVERFDTAEFLAFCNGDTLAEACQVAGIKPAAKVSDRRKQLEGRAPSWRPAIADYTARVKLPTTEDEGDDN